MIELPQHVRRAFSDIASQYDGAPRKAASQVVAFGDSSFTKLIEAVSSLIQLATEKADWMNPEGHNFSAIDKAAQEGLRLIEDEDALEASLSDLCLGLASEQGIDSVTARKQVKAGCEGMSQSFGKLPAYNQAQWLCREAAIAVGLWKFSKARNLLKMLFLISDSKARWEDAATQYTISSSGNLEEYSKAVSESVDGWGIPLFS